MSDIESLSGNLFEEPEEFRPQPPEPHFVTHDREDGLIPAQIRLRLVGNSPLWGHLLWNAGIFTANYLDKHFKELVEDKNVLELGAAAGLPSLICGLRGAKNVVCTDYPDADLMSNIQYNIDQCLKGKRNISAEGYIWGGDVTRLLEKTGGEKFDLIILSDVVFNHTEHEKLLTTCQRLLSPEGRCFVVFSPHRPWLLEQDLAFFEKAESEFGFRAEKLDLQRWKPMFEEDAETAEIRSRVYSYFLYPSNSI